MKNNSVKKWAAIAEIAGTVIVIVSLLFVIKSIDQNTKAIEAVEANNIWAAWREVGILPVINNPEFDGEKSEFYPSSTIQNLPLFT